MIPFPAEVKECFTKANLTDKLKTDLANWSVVWASYLTCYHGDCCWLLSFAGGTCGFSYREDRSCISLVVPLRSCKKDISTHLRSCRFSDPENEVDLFFSPASIFEMINDDFAICPTHRSNLDVGWSRGSNSRCWVLKEVSGHGKGRVKSIPKADRGIGKRVAQIVLKTSRKFIKPGSDK